MAEAYEGQGVQVNSAQFDGISMPISIQKV